MKKFIKENVKILVSIIVTAMVVSTTTVFAYSLMANDVSFTPVDNGWNVNNVGSALDDLRLKAGELSTNFSTNEKVVGTWIDGKPLYRKTIPFTIPAGSPFEGNITDINVTDVENIMISGGYFCQGNEWNQLNTFYTTGCYSYMSIYKSNNKYYLHMRQAGFNNKPAVAIIDYTKTTD